MYTVFFHLNHLFLIKYFMPFVFSISFSFLIHHFSISDSVFLSLMLSFIMDFMDFFGFDVL